jgi:hypothetical protein
MPILRSPMLLGSLETNPRQAASESTHERLSAATPVKLEFARCSKIPSCASRSLTIARTCADVERVIERPNSLKSSRLFLRTNSS